VNKSRIVTADQVIIAPDEPVVRDGAVLVTSDGKISAVGPSAELLARNSYAERLDFPTATVLPGLINTHVHLAFEATSDSTAALRRGDVEVVRTTITRHARELLDAGVTTVRDLGDRDGHVAELRDAVAAGVAVGPRGTAGSSAARSPTMLRSARWSPTAPPRAPT
jgi:imidazolonepropionase-like amidohydrolase